MEKKLRIKFILISISAVSIVLIAIAGFINISNYNQIGKHADEILQVLGENNGTFPISNKHKEKYDLPPKMSPEAPFSTRFFTILLDEKKNIIALDTGKIASVTREKAIEYSQNIIYKNKETGFIETYKYLIIEKKYGSMIILVDCSRDFQMFYSFLKNSIFICIIGILAVFILVLIFSKKAIAPIVESYEKQKKFITDAGHELKTPLAVISANIEVLELDYGENQWTNSTKNQINKLSKLIKNLISLSRMDESKDNFVKSNFSISNVVRETVDPYYVLAKNNDKEIAIDIENNIYFYGDEDAIRQLVIILLDNAVKYAAENSKITLMLKKKGKRCILKTVNKVDHIEKGNYSILFERFYRQDSSRNSKTGCYGIGLSIAKAICEKHKGKISAQSPDGKYLVITITL